jgi:hypothetical protein
MTVALVIGTVWLVIIVFTLALLRMAATADRDANRQARRLPQPARLAAERARRQRTEPVGSFTGDRRSGGDRRVAAR